jgi:DNA modification methylase
MKYYDYTLRQLRSGFWVDPYPLIWHKSDNRGTLPDPSRGPRRVYEVAFLASHGDRKITTAVSNLFAHSIGADREHMSLKPVPVLQHFFRMFVDSNTRILDPTCGSGTSLVAARNLGATHFLGLEVDKDFHDLAVRNWNDGQV